MNIRKKAFSDIYIIFLVLLLTFDIVGIPIFEVVILKRRFFENFGQVLHLISMFVVVPFTLYGEEISNIM